MTTETRHNIGFLMLGYSIGRLVAIGPEPLKLIVAGAALAVAVFTVALWRKE